LGQLPNARAHLHGAETAFERNADDTPLRPSGIR
jgi:hypothetical protein